MGYRKCRLPRSAPWKFVKNRVKIRDGLRKLAGTPADRHYLAPPPTTDHKKCQQHHWLLASLGVRISWPRSTSHKKNYWVNNQKILAFSGWLMGVVVNAVGVTEHRVPATRPCRLTGCHHRWFIFGVYSRRLEKMRESKRPKIPGPGPICFHLLALWLPYHAISCCEIPGFSIIVRWLHTWRALAKW